MTLSRRSLLSCAAAFAATDAFGQANSTPSSKPIRIVVPYAPGGAVDGVARLLAEQIPTRMNGRSAIVDNRSGAGGNIAEEFVAHAAPDGSTIIVTANNHTINASLYKRPGYDAERDFAPVAGIGESGFIIVAYPGAGLASLADMIAAARAKPDALSFGTGGNGHPAHLAAELLKSRAKISMQHVPYKGSGPLMTDVLGGQIPIAFGSIVAAEPFVKNGQLKGLAVTSGRRWPELPDVPTVAECGFDGYDYSAWIGVLTQQAVPAAIVAELQRAIMAIASTDDFNRRLFQQGMVGSVTDGATLGRLIASDLALNRKIIASLGLQLD